MENSSIRETAFQLGADICGVASTERFDNTPSGFHPEDILSGAKSVIVFGKPFLRGTFKAKSNAPYTLVRNKLIEKIDTISVDLASKIEEEGHDAVPIPSSEPYEFWDKQERHGRGILSLKHSAQLAGLGYIGKNTLLINPQYGNRLWLGAVITTAEFSPDIPVETGCPEGCMICIEACPQSALDGITINQKKCREICQTVTEGGGWLLSCNLCRERCPFSQIRTWPGEETGRK